MSDDAREEEFHRIIREEALVTDGDLRLEVSSVLQRSVEGDEDVMLYEKRAFFRGSLAMSRASRQLTVAGDYRQSTQGEDIVNFKGSYDETVNGNVFQQASLEAEHIVGGAYMGTFVGPTLRTLAMSDCLAWGGWAEVDATRIEIALVSVRAYWGYAQAVAARIICATSLIDDWQLRSETFGTFIDNQLDSTLLTGGPTGGMELHA